MLLHVAAEGDAEEKGTTVPEGWAPKSWSRFVIGLKRCKIYTGEQPHLAGQPDVGAVDDPVGEDLAQRGADLGLVAALAGHVNVPVQNNRCMQCLKSHFLVCLTP
jgi:hypothetical protein